MRNAEEKAFISLGFGLGIEHHELSRRLSAVGGRGAVPEELDSVPVSQTSLQISPEHCQQNARARKLGSSGGSSRGREG